MCPSLFNNDIPVRLIFLNLKCSAIYRWTSKDEMIFNDIVLQTITRFYPRYIRSHRKHLLYSTSHRVRDITENELKNQNMSQYALFSFGIEADRHSEGYLKCTEWRDIEIIVVGLVRRMIFPGYNLLLGTLWQ
jgi:hypothetical protein